MRLNFRKVSAIATSALLVGMTMGTAMAANYPAPFVSSGSADVAIVYGASSDAMDGTQAGNIQTELAKLVTTTGTISAGSIKLSDDEVELGGSIYGSKIPNPIQDNKLSGLKDTKFSWDDGDGSDDYDFHEDIAFVGTSNVLTTLNDEKLEGVALSNEKALEYKLVFEEAFNASRINTDDADTLYLEIMGQEYEIEKITSNSITVTTSKQMSMLSGDSATVEGKTVTVKNVFEKSVEVSVDGVTEIVTTSKKVNGLRVEVEDIGYHSNSPETSIAIIKVGKDISKEYKDGSEYIGQDEDDPLWIWDISFTIASDGLTTANDYIGVRYNAKIDSANDKIAGDTIKYVGDGYVFPHNYAAVTLDSLTDAKYQDVKIYFEDSVDLFDASSTSSAFAENVPVLAIKAENEDTITVGGKETNLMYVYYNSTADKFQTFYKDVTGDYSPTGYMRLANASATDAVGADMDLSATELATLEIGDTNLDVNISVSSGVASLIVTNDDYAAGDDLLKLTLGGDKINEGNTTGKGTLERLGLEAEKAEAGDISFSKGHDLSLKDYDYMDGYGVFLSKGTTVKDEADDDKVTLSVPEEQVYAQVTVSMGDVAVDGEGALGGILVVKDTEVESVKAKNLIVVGGSCVNTVAAQLLGTSGVACGVDFTAKAGVGAGQFLIKSYTSPYTSGKIALLVAGYERDDTRSAVTYLNTNNLDVSVGKSYPKDSITYTAVGPQ